jgi:hypothetical protein
MAFADSDGEVDSCNISLHIANIYKEGVLDRSSVVKEYLTTASDDKCYNLDVIISAGYHVKSFQGTQFFCFSFWPND